MDGARVRLDELAAAWHVEIQHVITGERAVVGFGALGARPVVLKVNAGTGGEPFATGVLEAFGGRGAVRVYAQAPDAALLERARPGHTLADVVAQDGDGEATRLLAQLVARMSPGPAPQGVPTATEWGRGFARRGRGVYDRLAATQRHERLLHGDLHHGNVVFDHERGWLVIDPKGVVAELEFELGAALRNPWDRPALFTDPGVIRRRARTLADGLRLDLDCPYLTLAERLRSV